MKQILARLAKNPVVTKTFHTAWEAALGALLAQLSGTHGDAKAILLVVGAATAAAVKNVVVEQLTHTPAPAPVPAPAADPASGSVEG